MDDNNSTNRWSLVFHSRIEAFMLVHVCIERESSLCYAFSGAPEALCKFSTFKKPERGAYERRCVIDRYEKSCNFMQNYFRQSARRSGNYGTSHLHRLQCDIAKCFPPSRWHNNHGGPADEPGNFRGVDPSRKCHSPGNP